jgi:anhydro-N-acetylmuramic acid kinase
MRVAGIMSGTSVDGIDVAVVDFEGELVSPVGHVTIPWPPEIRRRILAVSDARCSTAEISRLSFELGELYALAVTAACRNLEIETDSLELAGCHGQTIYHDGRGEIPNTLQIGEAAVIAERLNIPVVSDFRVRDIAAGGQGAPLVPFADYLLFRSPNANRAALNIGGIANLTILPSDATPDLVTAFDTGPGNMIVDQLVERMTAGENRFDQNGDIAARGHIIAPLLDSLLEDPYFRAEPPKTAGREQFGAAFVDRLMATGAAMDDLIATATAFTAASIAAGLTLFGPATEELIVSGGGTHNSQLMAQLAAFLPSCRVSTTEQFGTDPDAKEAIAFAILAHRTWKRETGNLPGATGARKSVILGKISF